MRKCLFERDNLLEQLDNAASRTGIETAEAETRDIRSQLAGTLSPDQMKMLRAFDDAVVREGTVRVNAALIMACGCKACAALRRGPEDGAVPGGISMAA